MVVVRLKLSVARKRRLKCARDTTSGRSGSKDVGQKAGTTRIEGESIRQGAAIDAAQSRGNSPRNGMSVLDRPAGDRCEEHL